MVNTSLSGPLAVRRFRSLWIASVFSNVGGFFQTVAATWLMLELTGSPFWVAAMAASTTLPLLFLSLPAGALADLTNRRNLLLASQVTMGTAVIAMAVMELIGSTTPELLLAFGLIQGVGVAFNAPVWQAMVPDLVPRQRVASAVALNSVSFNVARAVGPALGGVVVATLGPGVAFSINAVSYLGIIAVVASFSSSDWTPQSETSITGAITLGLRYARFTPALHWLLGIASGFAITSAALNALLPNLTADKLGGGAGLYGLLLGAMGIGAVFAGLTRSWWTRRMGSRAVPAGVAMFGVAAVGVGLAPTAWMAAAGMAAAGVAWVWTLATLNATIQLISHSWVRGRSLSLYMLAFSGVLPVGALIAGAIADQVGAATTIVGMSLGAIALGLATFRMPIPGLDEVVSPEAPKDWDLHPHENLAVSGDKVMVVNTWTIDEEDLSEFLAVMADLRLVRLSTGAQDWSLYRNVGDPHQMTEVFINLSWDDHLLQHERIDVAATATIRRAREFDRADGPFSRHLVAFEVVDPQGRPDWSELVVRHSDSHEADGSIPLPGIQIHRVE